MKVRNRTSQIKPATRHAILDQLALAADEIIRLRFVGAGKDNVIGLYRHYGRHPWGYLWQRIRAWWRA